MVTVYLALGSNVGDSEQYITQAIDQLGLFLHDIQRAPIYGAKAVGYKDQSDFLNTAIRAQTDLSPQQLLKRIEAVEQQVGRVKRFHWGPREIDIDIIFYGSQTSESKQLIIPHPHFHERDFVLQPLVDLNRKLVDPRSHKTVQYLLDQLAPDQLSITYKVSR